MRVLVQRSKESSVIVNNKVVGSIPKGMVILVGFTHTDNEVNINKMISKILNLRIFDDEQGVMNKNILDYGGNILSISQFTLYANAKKGNRPSYFEALDYSKAEVLYNLFNTKLQEHLNIATGIFGADMEVHITNDGPVTIMLEE